MTITLDGSLGMSLEVIFTSSDVFVFWVWEAQESLEKRREALSVVAADGLVAGGGCSRAECYI